jgi:hypothetical protein
MNSNDLSRAATATGTVYWVASYNRDSNNHLPAGQICGSAAGKRAAAAENVAGLRVVLMFYVILCAPYAYSSAAEAVVASRRLRDAVGSKTPFREKERCDVAVPYVETVWRFKHFDTAQRLRARIEDVGLRDDCVTIREV